jgi:phosphatidylserine/phosphatidylglycerophosphate/cardiolipin synthase-like enzyme
MNRLRVSLIVLLAAALTAGGVVYAQSVSSAKLTNTQVDWAFTQADQHPEKLLADVIHSAKSTLDIAIYSITLPDIVQAIKDAKQRGVVVRIISDKTEAGGKAQSEALKILGSAGIPIKLNTHSGLMHLKVTIADKKVATTGSFNYSNSASTTNDEVLMVLHDNAIAKSFEAQFEKMWNDTKGFKSVSYSIAQPATEQTSKTSAAGSDSVSTVSYANCTAVKAAGKAPLRKGDPGYSTRLDRDGDGVACEQ